MGQVLKRHRQGAGVRCQAVEPQLGGIVRHSGSVTCLLMWPPLVGEPELEWSALTWNADPDVQIIAWTAAPGAVSRERLARLRALV